MEGDRLPQSFFQRDVLDVAPELLGKILVRNNPAGVTSRYIISETEAYRGTDDLACHASRGMTPRTEVMFREGGLLYMYLIYGMYWMMNIVTGPTGVPQAALIRGITGVTGPGRLSRQLELDGSFNGENLLNSDRIWMEDSPLPVNYSTHPRIGIDYAGEYWKSRLWRFILTDP